MRALLLIGILFTSFFQEVSYARELRDGSCYTGSRSTFESITNFYNDFIEEINQCDTLDIPEEQRRGVGSDKSLSPASFGRCLREFVRGLINFMVESIEAIYEGVKFLFKGLVNSYRTTWNFVKTAFTGGISTAVTELLENSQTVFNRIFNLIKQIPMAILSSAKEEVAEFNCLNNDGKTQYVCRALGFIGPEIALAVLTGGGSAALRAQRVGANAIRTTLNSARRATNVLRTTRLGRASSRAFLRTINAVNDIKLRKSLKRLANSTPTSVADDLIIGRHPRIAGRVDDLRSQALKLDGELDVLRNRYEGLIDSGASPREIARLENQLRKKTREVRETSIELGELSTKQQLAQLVDSGAVDPNDITVVRNAASRNRDLTTSYAEFNDGGTIYRIKPKKKFQICRGSSITEAVGAKSPGNYFNPCSTGRYQDSAVSSNLNATADNSFDAFIKYEFEAGAEFDLAAVAPVHASDGLGGAHRYQYTSKRTQQTTTQNARGLGGNVQFVNVNRENIPNRVRAVAVGRTPEVRRLQSRIRRSIETGRTERLKQLRDQVDRRRRTNKDYEIVYEELDAAIEGREINFNNICIHFDNCPAN